MWNPHFKNLNDISKKMIPYRHLVDAPNVISDLCQSLTYRNIQV